MKTTVKQVVLADLHPFPNNPFSVREDAELQESIQEYGVITPLVVRPRTEGGYEIVSGHSRHAACEAAGIAKVPAVVREMDDSTAVIVLVDSNIQREHVLPSEKAKAYKMKLEALKQQGKRTDLEDKETCGQVVHKSRDEVAKGESGRQVQRYVRLTELLPEILQMVDEGKVAFTPAVELSYLTKEEQANLLETMGSEDRTPSVPQAQQMRRLSAEGQLDMDRIFNILTEEKPNQKEQVKLPVEDIRKFFPKNYDPQRMEQTIIKLLGEWQRKRQRAAKERNNDAR